MVDVALVRMFGNVVGTFSWDERYGVARFEYDRSFVGKGLEPAPLMMPVREGRVYSFANLGRETFNGLPGLLADSLPDTYGRALFDRWRRDAPRGSVLVVDELPYLVESSPELPSVIQRIVDGLRTEGKKIILAGSSQRMMQGFVLKQSEPLYGRAREIMPILPLS